MITCPVRTSIAMIDQVASAARGMASNNRAVRTSERMGISIQRVGAHTSCARGRVVCVESPWHIR